MGSGDVDYIQEPSFASLVQHQSRTRVKQGSWLCEAALWTRWIHVGSAYTLSPVKLVAVNAQQMFQLVQRHSLLYKLALDYGTQFHECVVNGAPPSCPWPTDMEVPFTRWAELVQNMDIQSRRVVGLSALTQLSRFHRHHLEGEVSRGEAMVVLNSTGSPERVIIVARVHILRSDGAMLVQLGKLLDSDVVPHLRAPALRQEQGELPLEAAKRSVHQIQCLFDDTGLDADRMESLLNLMYFSHHEEDVVHSHTYVHTRYLHQVFHLHVEAEEIVAQSFRVDKRLSNHRRSQTHQRSLKKTRRSSGTLSQSLDWFKSRHSNEADAEVMELPTKTDVYTITQVKGESMCTRTYAFLTLEQVNILQRASHHGFTREWLLSIRRQMAARCAAQPALRRSRSNSVVSGCTCDSDTDSWFSG